MDVSFIVPLYNGKKYINKIISMLEKNRKCLEKNGWNKEIEVIFINDNPKEIIVKQDMQMSEEISNIALITNDTNLGIHRTRVRGLESANGQYVVFMDQDDEITDDYLLSQFQNIINSDAVLCNGVYRGNKVIYSDEVHQKEAVTKNIFIREQNLIISPGQVMIARTAIPDDWTKYFLYENGSDDVLLWILMLRDYEKICINPYVKYCHVEDGKNTSLNFTSMKKSIEELFRVVKDNRLLAGEDYCLFEKAIHKRLDKYDRYIEILDNWERITGSIGKLIEREKYHSIAIYGYGIVGRKLLKDLAKLGISVDFFIDREAISYKVTGYPIYSLEETQKDAELIIITPLFAENEIRKDLEKKKGKVVSLKEFL